jgi:Protein of unknown function (DUF2510)
MGLFDKRKDQTDEMTNPAWEADRARIASFLYRARTFNGTGPEDPTLKISLRDGERALLVATGVFLVEPLRIQAYWTGTRSGIGFGVKKSTSNSVGQLPGAPTDPGPQPVDTGDVTFTDQRLSFSGTRGTKDWEYSDLVGFEHVDNPAWTALALSTEDRVGGIRYDDSQAEEIRFAIALGVSRNHKKADLLFADLQAQLDEMDRGHTENAQPAAAPAATAATGWQQPSSSYPPAAPAGTAASWQQAPSTSLPTPPPAAVPSPVPMPVPPAPAPPVASETVTAAGAEPIADVTTEAVPAMPAGEPTSTPPTPPATSMTEPATEPPQPDVPGVSKQDEVPTGEIPEVHTGEIPAMSQPTAVYPTYGAQATTGLPGSEQQVGSAQTYATPAGGAQGQPAQGQGQPAANMAPGWYPDPWRLARVRWWDGYAWTAYTSN